MNERKRLGLALCGSYCTYEKVLKEAEKLAADWDITAVMSETAACTDSRFGKAEDFIARLEALTGKPVMRTITAAERVGPERLFDVLLIAPCTGATLARLATGLTDTAVTMAAKSHLRNGRPVVIALSTNDALSGSAETSLRCSTARTTTSCPSARTTRRESPPLCRPISRVWVRSPRPRSRVGSSSPC